MINTYFQEYVADLEQNLVHDLVIESIQIHGVETYYIPRNAGNVDYLYGEDILSNFTETYPIEMYIESVDGFDGQGEFLAKFGLQINNQIEMSVSIRRFAEVLNGALARPREGDLVYLGFKPNLFEIKHVENKKEFFQLNDVYRYTLKLEAFRYEQEVINTNIDEIDQIAREIGYTIVLNMGAGSGNYIVSEAVYQGANLATANALANVVSWNATTKELSVQYINGDFSVNTAIVGQTSSASYILTSYDDLNDQNDLESYNREIINEANTFINFSEDNPFSETDP